MMQNAEQEKPLYNPDWGMHYSEVGAGKKTARPSIFRLHLKSSTPCQRACCPVEPPPARAKKAGKARLCGSKVTRQCGGWVLGTGLHKLESRESRATTTATIPLSKG